MKEDRRRIQLERTRVLGCTTLGQDRRRRIRQVSSFRRRLFRFEFGGAVLDGRLRLVWWKSFGGRREEERRREVAGSSAVDVAVGREGEEVR